MSRPGIQSLGECLLRPAALVSDSFRQPEVLLATEHRPWPLPAEPWFMGQIWHHLLFAHWRLPAAELERVVPPQLTLDTFEGDAWIGVTPFFVASLRLRGTPPAPVLSSFPEINVRTYVTVDGKPGIYFLSLDAGSWLAVAAARRSYRLPYFRSRFTTWTDAGAHRYEAERISPDGPAARFAATYQPLGEPLPIHDGSLERWLTERYCLYTLDDEQRILRGEIHHPPWPLHEAGAEIEANTMASAFGIELVGEPLLHLSQRQDVAIWPLRPAGR